MCLQGILGRDRNITLNTLFVRNDLDDTLYEDVGIAIGHVHFRISCLSVVSGILIVIFRWSQYSRGGDPMRWSN